MVSSVVVLHCNDGSEASGSPDAITRSSLAPPLVAPRSSGSRGIRGPAPRHDRHRRLGGHRLRAGAAVRLRRQRCDARGAAPRASRAGRSRKSEPRPRSMSACCRSTSRCPTRRRQIEAALASHGAYADVLVNNAGIGLAGPFHAHAAGDVLRLVDLNVRALTHPDASFPARHARARPRRHSQPGLASAASRPGRTRLPTMPARPIVLSLTEAIAAETAGEGVRVCALAPGPVNTRWHEKAGRAECLLPQLRAAGVGTIGRLGRLSRLRARPARDHSGVGKPVHGSSHAHHAA